MCEHCNQVVANFPNEMLEAFESLRTDTMILAQKAAEVLQKVGYIRIPTDEEDAKKAGLVPFTEADKAEGLPEKFAQAYAISAIAGFVANSIKHDSDLAYAADELHRQGSTLGWAVGHIQEQAKAGSLN